MLKRRTKRLVALGMCLMMMLSSGLMASAATYPHEFSFYLSKGGDKQQSASARKTNNLTYARFNFTTCINRSELPVIFRLRSVANDTFASDVQYLTGTGYRSVPYAGGYGLNGYSYYFKIQTDSNSNYGATVKGSWEP